MCLLQNGTYTGFFFQNRNVNRLVFARIKSQIKKNQMSVVTCTGYEIYIKSNEENIAKNIHLVYLGILCCVL